MNANANVPGQSYLKLGMEDAMKERIVEEAEKEKMGKLEAAPIIPELSLRQNSAFCLCKHVKPTQGHNFLVALAGQIHSTLSIFPANAIMIGWASTIGIRSLRFIQRADTSTMRGSVSTWTLSVAQAPHNHR
jgi:hypothetical protein